jgi:hypothetical protein
MDIVQPERLPAPDLEPRPRLAVPPVFGFSRLLVGAGMLSAAHTLGALKEDGLLFYFGGSLGTDVLVATCLAIAWLCLLRAAWVLVPAAANLIPRSSLHLAVKILLWTPVTAGLLLLGLFVAWTAVVAETTYHHVKSPNGTQELLIVDSSFLLVGAFDVYEPSAGPVLLRAGRLSTDDGYDPFEAGEYAIDWSETSAIISYVYDYMDPDIRNTIAVPLSTEMAHD